MSAIPRGDIIIILGDFNAQVGPTNTNMENVMGKHGIGTMNENGEVVTCFKHNLVIGGTLLINENNHKITWVSPYKATENPIGHFAICRT